MLGGRGERPRAGAPGEPPLRSPLAQPARPPPRLPPLRKSLIDFPLKHSPRVVGIFHQKCCTL